MTSALQALRAYVGRTPAPQGKADEAFATLKISSNKKGFMALLSTHPDLGDRIKAVQAL